MSTTLLPATIPQESGGGLTVVQGETITFMPVVTPAELLARRKELFEVVKNVLKEGEHYGTTPGASKKNLLKPGGEILNQYFGLYAEFECVSRVENWEMKPPLFDYEFKCVLRSKRDTVKIAEGVGSCNSYESKYRYRDAKRSCPSCSRAGSIVKGKEEYGGGWVCWAKDGNCCKAKFKDNDPAIVSQALGKVDNEDIASLKNTILKMAAKRAYIDATLKGTAASEIFTQDIEDMPFIVEVITAEVVSEAVKEQNDARQEERQAPKPSGKSQSPAQEAEKGAAVSGSVSPAQTNSQTAGVNPDPKPASVPQQNGGTSGTTGTTAQPQGDVPKSQAAPVGTADQAAANASTAASAASSATATKASPSELITKAHLDQLLEAGVKNGWTQKQISDFVCHAFGLTPQTLPKQFTVKQWEIAFGLVSYSKNAKGVVAFKADGTALPVANRWPKAS